MQKGIHENLLNAAKLVCVKIWRVLAKVKRNKNKIYNKFCSAKQRQNGKMN